MVQSKQHLYHSMTKGCSTCCDCPTSCNMLAQWDLACNVLQAHCASKRSVCSTNAHESVAQAPSHSIEEGQNMQHQVASGCTFTRSSGATAVLAMTAAPATVMSWKEDSRMRVSHMLNVGSLYCTRSFSLTVSFGVNGVVSCAPLVFVMATHPGSGTSSKELQTQEHLKNRQPVHILLDERPTPRGTRSARAAATQAVTLAPHTQGYKPSLSL